MSRVVIGALALALGCAEVPQDSGNDTASDDPSALAVLPTLSVTAPQRGAFHPGLELQVSGQAAPGDAALETLWVDEVEVPLDADGQFATTLVGPPGLLLVGARVEDEDGERATDGRAVQIGDTHPPGATLQRAAWVQLGPSLLDDDDDDLDDLAALGQAALTDTAFTDALVGSQFEGPVDVTITALSIADAAIDIAPWHDVLWFDVALIGVQVGFQTTIDGVTRNGSATLAQVAVQLDLTAALSRSKQVVVEVSHVVPRVDGLTWQSDGVPAWAADLLTGTLEDLLEDTLGAQADDALSALLAEGLAAFGVDLTIGAAGELGVLATLGEIRLAPEGVVLGFDMRTEARAPAFALPEHAGSLRRETGPPAVPSNGPWPLLVLIAGDVLNQALFATWHAGFATGLGFTGEAIEAASGAALPPPLGPARLVTIDLGLPPVLTPADGDYDANLGVGELRVDIERTDGAHITTSLSVSGGADVRVQDGGLVVDLDGRPASIDLNAGMLAWPEALDPGSLSSLFRLAAPGLVRSAAEALPPIPLPSVDLGAITGLSSLQGTTWQVTDGDVRLQADGWLRIEAEMETSR